MKNPERTVLARARAISVPQTSGIGEPRTGRRNVIGPTLTSEQTSLRCTISETTRGARLRWS